jgi:hypothetical protein
MELSVDCTAKAKAAEAGALVIYHLLRAPSRPDPTPNPKPPTPNPTPNPAASDLKVRLASLQRARDKMKEMDATIETCNAQVSDGAR